MFFLERKNQRTFATAPTARRSLHRICAAPGIKVFWFFFSKKNPYTSPSSQLSQQTLASVRTRPI
jgi:hypothetical protein